MGTITLSTRRSYLAGLMNVNGTIETAMSTKLDRLIQRALRDVYKFHRWPFLEDEFREELEAAYSTGTVAGSAGGTAITGTGTSWDTGWSEHVLLRAGGEVYRVASVDSTTGLTLTDALLSDLSGADYILYVPRYTLGSTLETITTVWLATPDSRLTYISPVQMDELWSQNGALTGHPAKWTQRGVDANGYPVIEVFPIPGYNEILHIRGHKAGTIPTADGGTDSIPDRFSTVVDQRAEALMWKQANDLNRYQLAEAEYRRAILEMLQDCQLGQGEMAFHLDASHYVHSIYPYSQGNIVWE